MKKPILILISIPILFVVITCRQNPVDSEPARVEKSYWPELGSYSPLLPGAAGFHTIIVDPLRTEVFDDTCQVEILTSTGDYEVQTLYCNHWYYGPPLTENWPVVHTDQSQKNDGIFQIAPRGQNGWFLIKYHSKWSN
jgi:hypothetical protein